MPERPTTMPALFIGHGSPMNAVEDSEFALGWARIAAALPAPTAILCVSAHWETEMPRLTAMEHPRTIHDFRGFPEKLFQLRYPASGSPALASRIQSLVTCADIQLDQESGLDHGAWSVLCRMFPRADIPVLQLSLDRTRPAEFHFTLGAALRPLRDEGVLIIGSGNIVHNLGALVWKDSAFDWAEEFDAAVEQRILASDFDGLIHYDRLGPSARMAVPTPEHFLPLLYVLGAKKPGEPCEFFCDRITLGSISMRSLKLG